MISDERHVDNRIGKAAGGAGDERIKASRNLGSVLQIFRRPLSLFMADCTVAWSQIGERSGHAETGRNMWAAVRTHRCINARVCCVYIPEIILQARDYPLAMLEVRGDEVNLESDGIHGLYRTPAAER